MKTTTSDTPVSIILSLSDLRRLVKVAKATGCKRRGDIILLQAPVTTCEDGLQFIHTYNITTPHEGKNVGLHHFGK